MAVSRALLRSESDEWETPQDLFSRLHREFHFDLDVCASQGNAKCSLFYSEQDDGLNLEWFPITCWMNPPYSDVGSWMRKAFLESLCGATVVCLVAARTDTNWWHHWAMKGEIRFIRQRLKFGSHHNSDNSAPFPSAIVIFRRVPDRERLNWQAVFSLGSKENSK